MTYVQGVEREARQGSGDNAGAVREGGGVAPSISGPRKISWAEKDVRRGPGQDSERVEAVFPGLGANYQSWNHVQHKGGYKSSPQANTFYICFI